MMNSEEYFMNLSVLGNILSYPITHYIVTIYAVLIAWEASFPSRSLQAGGRKITGVGVFTFYFLLSSYLPWFFNSMPVEYHIIDLSPLGMVMGTGAAVLIYETIGYLLHRQMHQSKFLWKTFHQIYHRPEMARTYGAFFCSPLEMIGRAVLSSVFFFFVFGLKAHTITATLLITNFLSIFQHAKIQTPRWLGYIVQRPEGRVVHYTDNALVSNYANLPLLDILFGTFKQPGLRAYHPPSDKEADSINDVSNNKVFLHRERAMETVKSQHLLDLT